MDLSLTSWCLGLAAALLVGFSKTGVPGLGLLAVILMAEAFPAKLSVGVILPMLIVGDVFAVSYYHRHAQWRRLWGLFPSIIPGLLLGAWVLNRITSEQLKPGIGYLVLVLIALDFARRKYKWTHVPDAWWFILAVGLLAGFTTMVANAAGAIIGLYLLSKGMGKNDFLGTGAWYYLLVNCAKVPISWDIGIITPATLAFNLWTIPVIVIGALAGVRVLPKIPQGVFDALVIVLAAAAALRLILA